MAEADCPITNCHGTVIQFFVKDNSLSMVMYQRSCDMVCGVPHNWVQYWAMLVWFARRTGLSVGDFTWIGGDVHVYEEHFDLARRICEAAGRSIDDLIDIDLIYKPRNVDKFKADDFALSAAYEPVLEDKAELVV